MPVLDQQEGTSTMRFGDSLPVAAVNTTNSK
jgi:hypothetical protein